jgi:biotin carboxyl carrier protein
MKYITIIKDTQYEIEIGNDGTIRVNGEPRTVDFLPLGEALYSVITDDRSIEVAIEEKRGQTDVLLQGKLYEARVFDERALLMAGRKGGLGGDSGDLHSPMPGLIVAVNVAAGDSVTQGQTVVILESMKMQNELKAPADGVVHAVHVQAGQTVEKDAPLLVIARGEAG